MKTKKLFQKSLALSVAVICLCQSSAYALPRGMGQDGITNPETQALTKLSIPEDLGSLDSFHLSKDPTRPFIIHIRDAHAILDAQENIHKLIRFAREQYGATVVALEGVQGELDPTVLRSVPDEFLKKNIVSDYFSRNELTGAEMAAILGPEDIRYVGIEDWEVYEANYFAYLMADQNKQALLSRIHKKEDELLKSSEEIFSSGLSSFHRAVAEFYENHESFSKLLQEIEHLWPENLPDEAKYPKVQALLKLHRIKQVKHNEELSLEMKQVLQEFEKKVFVKMGNGDQKDFHASKQAFLTGTMETVVFLSRLENWGAQYGVQMALPHEFAKQTEDHRAFQMMKGSHLVSELEQFLSDAEDLLAKDSNEQEILNHLRRLRVLKNLAALELTRAEFEKLKKTPDDYLSLIPENQEMLSSALQFYELALKRDFILHENLEKQIRSTNAKVVVLIAGGFHSPGFEKFFKASDYSYAVITPAMNSIAGSEDYEKLMKGQVSWIKSASGSLYHRFMTDAVKKVRSRFEQNRTEEMNGVWRDELIRNLARKGKLAESRSYTKYIDDSLGVTARQTELPQILKKIEDETIQNLRAEFEARLPEIVNGISQLMERNNLNPQAVQKFLQSIAGFTKSTIQVPEAAKLDPQLRPHKSMFDAFLGKPQWRDYASALVRQILAGNPLIARSEVRSEVPTTPIIDIRNVKLVLVHTAGFAGQAPYDISRASVPAIQQIATSGIVLNGRNTGIYEYVNADHRSYFEETAEPGFYRNEILQDSRAGRITYEIPGLSGKQFILTGGDFGRVENPNECQFCLFRAFDAIVQNMGKRSQTAGPSLEPFEIHMPADATYSLSMKETPFSGDEFIPESVETVNPSLTDLSNGVSRYFAAMIPQSLPFEIISISKEGSISQITSPTDPPRLSIFLWEKSGDLIAHFKTREAQTSRSEARTEPEVQENLLPVNELAVPGSKTYEAILRAWSEFDSSKPDNSDFNQVINPLADIGYFLLSRDSDGRIRTDNIPDDIRLGEDGNESILFKIAMNRKYYVDEFDGNQRVHAQGKVDLNPGFWLIRRVTHPEYGNGYEVVLADRGRGFLDEDEDGVPDIMRLVQYKSGTQYINSRGIADFGSHIGLSRAINILPEIEIVSNGWRWVKGVHPFKLFAKLVDRNIVTETGEKKRISVYESDAPGVSAVSMSDEEDPYESPNLWIGTTTELEHLGEPANEINGTMVIYRVWDKKPRELAKSNLDGLDDWLKGLTEKARLAKLQRSEARAQLLDKDDQRASAGTETDKFDRIVQEIHDLLIRERFVDARARAQYRLGELAQQHVRNDDQPSTYSDEEGNVQLWLESVQDATDFVTETEMSEGMEALVTAKDEEIKKLFAKEPKALLIPMYQLDGTLLRVLEKLKSTVGVHVGILPSLDDYRDFPYYVISHSTDTLEELKTNFYAFRNRFNEPEQVANFVARVSTLLHWDQERVETFFHRRSAAWRKISNYELARFWKQENHLELKRIIIKYTQVPGLSAALAQLLHWPEESDDFRGLVNELFSVDVLERQLTQDYDVEVLAFGLFVYDRPFDAVIRLTPKPETVNPKFEQGIYFIETKNVLRGFPTDVRRVTLKKQVPRQLLVLKKLVTAGIPIKGLLLVVSKGSQANRQSTTPFLFDERLSASKVLRDGSVIKVFTVNIPAYDARSKIDNTITTQPSQEQVERWNELPPLTTKVFFESGALGDPRAIEKNPDFNKLTDREEKLHRRYSIDIENQVADQMKRRKAIRHWKDFFRNRYIAVQDSELDEILKAYFFQEVDLVDLRTFIELKWRLLKPGFTGLLEWLQSEGSRLTLATLLDRIQLLQDEMAARIRSPKGNGKKEKPSAPERLSRALSGWGDVFLKHRVDLNLSDDETDELNDRKLKQKVEAVLNQYFKLKFQPLSSPLEISHVKRFENTLRDEFQSKGAQNLWDEILLTVRTNPRSETRAEDTASDDSLDALEMAIRDAKEKVNENLTGITKQHVLGLLDRAAKVLRSNPGEIDTLMQSALNFIQGTDSMTKAARAAVNKVKKLAELYKRPKDSGKRKPPFLPTRGPGRSEVRRTEFFDLLLPAEALAQIKDRSRIANNMRAIADSSLAEFDRRFSQLQSALESAGKGELTRDQFESLVVEYLGEWAGVIDLNRLFAVISSQNGDQTQFSTLSSLDIQNIRALLNDVAFLEKYFPTAFQEGQSATLDSEIIFALRDQGYSEDQIRSDLSNQFSQVGVLYELGKYDSEVHRFAAPLAARFRPIGYKQVRKPVSYQQLVAGDDGVPFLWARTNTPLNLSTSDAKAESLRNQGVQLSAEVIYQLAAHKLSPKEVIQLFRLYSTSELLRTQLKVSNEFLPELDVNALQSGLRQLSALWASELQARQRLQSAA